MLCVPCSMIIGHEKQRDLLKAYVKNKRVPHAMLFSGEEGLGKKKVALEFLKLLNCQNDDFKNRPCGVCASCRQITKGTHPDSFFVEPEKENISILQIRKLSEIFVLKSVFQWKTAVLNKAHSMTREAQNCLLKTLEEPLGSSCLILVSEHPNLLLKTILSRVQEIKFFSVKKEEILNYLTEKNIAKEKAQEIADLSFGKPGRAIEFALNPQKLKESKSVIKELLSLLQGDIAFRFNYAKPLSSDYDLKNTFEIWTKYLREILLQRSVVGDQEGARRTKKIIEEILRTQLILSTKNVNKRLALENLFLKI